MTTATIKPPTILCCMCGVAMDPNQANMCSDCLRSQVNITSALDPNATIFQCKGCQRWQRGTSGAWLAAPLESAELMSLVLKRITGLNKLTLVDASFVWTEPHSKRLKVKLVVQKEVEEMNHAKVQQSVVIELVIKNQQCLDCAKTFHNDTWRGLVQIRQKVGLQKVPIILFGISDLLVQAGHKRTLLSLEQKLISSNSFSSATGISHAKDGLDFYFASKNDAERFCHHVAKLVPQRTKHTEQLVSEDVRNNAANIKHTFVIEIVPVCREDLVILPRRVAAQCGGIASCVLVNKVASGLHVLDPFSLKQLEISSDKYWRTPFEALLTSRQLKEFTVLDIEPVNQDWKQTGNKTSPDGWILAEAEVARSADLGVNDDVFFVTTHLGQLLKPGDTALGYDLTSCNFNDQWLEELRGENLPPVVLVKKQN